jgi:N-acetylmuramoyl-L-alanine amidase
MAHIILDIGHAKGTGARGNGQEEHNLASKVANLLAPVLKRNGHKVTVIDYPYLSNKDDLNRTIAAANALSGVTFGVSLHMDSSSNTGAHGGHVCYTSTKGKQIATAIADYLTDYMPGRACETVRRTDLAVLNRTKWPWVLIELGFISSKVDIKKLMDDPDTKENELAPLVNALVKGICKAL